MWWSRQTGVEPPAPLRRQRRGRPHPAIAKRSGKELALRAAHQRGLAMTGLRRKQAALRRVATPATGTSPTRRPHLLSPQPRHYQCMHAALGTGRARATRRGCTSVVLRAGVRRDDRRGDRLPGRPDQEHLPPAFPRQAGCARRGSEDAVAESSPHPARRRRSMRWQRGCSCLWRVPPGGSRSRGGRSSGEC
jgi:hypothetical protein